MPNMNPHMKDFEREAALTGMFADSVIRNRIPKWMDFMEIAHIINPEICRGSWERRPCRRKLRYVGYDHFAEPARSNPPDDARHAYGGLYHSLDFNGATYTIEETGATMGYAYFDVVDDPTVSSANYHRAPSRNERHTSRSA